MFFFENHDTSTADVMLTFLLWGPYSETINTQSGRFDIIIYVVPWASF